MGGEHLQARLDRGEPRVVVQPEIDGGTALESRTQDSNASRPSWPGQRPTTAPRSRRRKVGLGRASARARCAAKDDYWL